MAGGEFAGFVDYFLFGFEVLFEVVIAQLLVNLEIVGELLACIGESFPQRGFLGRGYIASGVELLYKLAVPREGAVYVVGIFGQHGYFCYDGIFLFEVADFEFFLFLGPGSFAVAYGVENRLEFVDKRLWAEFAFRRVGIISRHSFMERVELLSQPADFVARHFGGVFLSHGFGIFDKDFHGKDRLIRCIGGVCIHRFRVLRRHLFGCRGVEGGSGHRGKFVLCPVTHFHN